MTNCNISRKRGDELSLKILDSTEIGKIAVNSIVPYSNQTDACPLPEMIVYGISLSIDY